MDTTEYLIETSDRCLLLVKTGRRLADELESIAHPEFRDQCACIIAAAREAMDELERIGQDLLAKAVELDAQRQRTSLRPSGS